jgi:hypothetical protein
MHDQLQYVWPAAECSRLEVQQVAFLESEHAATNKALHSDLSGGRMSKC